MSNDKTTATERNAFDIALQYATGIKIGADWREIALGVESGMYRRLDNDERYYNLHRVADNGTLDVVFISDGEYVDLVGRFIMESCDRDSVLILDDGSVWSLGDAASGDIDRITTQASACIVLRYGHWTAALELDARLHRKPSWRERAAEAARPLVDGTVRREVGNSIVVGDDSDADAEVAE